MAIKSNSMIKFWYILLHTCVLGDKLSTPAQSNIMYRYRTVMLYNNYYSVINEVATTFRITQCTEHKVTKMRAKKVVVVLCTVKPVYTVTCIKQSPFACPGIENCIWIEHLLFPVFNRVHVTPSLVLCVCFVDHCLSFCPFSFYHCVVFSSS